ncbi:MAG: hypothetical protein IJH34_00860 [Romboutsia sp.]|nr:hypothetical protein [Romboutsia sp.]
MIDDDLLGLFLDIVGSWLEYIGYVIKNYFLVFIGIAISIIGYYMWCHP